ncbi:MAG: restriction endonuclease subunit S, partial [Campylobacterota bacterium]|nr:restriction endonuclease subunit S [Campylobacterota bacterium]
MSKFKLSDGINKDKIFLINSNELTTQWSPTFYHKEQLKYLDIFLNSNYRFDIKKLNKIINISSAKSVASKVGTYIGMANIESSTGKYIPSENDKGKGDCSLFKKGDVLFGKLRPYLNKVYLADFNGGCTTEFIVMNTLDENIISNKFLSIFLLLDCVVNQTKHMMTGNTLPRLQTFDIENLIIPIPPKNIQQEIINIMDNAYIQKKQKEKQAKDLLDSINTYLLDELGITLPETDNSLEKRIFEVNLSDVSGGRYDVSYYKPYYDSFKNCIKKSNSSLFILKDLIYKIDTGNGIYKFDKEGVNYLNVN